MSGRLLQQPSLYLRQHASNPVEWYPWGDEAFAFAAATDRPIFLSVGYSSCHWCHVMEHESFENEEIAEILNRSFVSIKVDREERPDVDELYMTFVQMLTGRGGWPMSVFLFPDKSPFYGGTYFPREDRDDFAGFRSVLLSIERLWKEKRKDLREAANYYRGGLREAVAEQARSRPGALPSLTSLLETLEQSFDVGWGGFSKAPKFPPHSALDLLLTVDPTERMSTKTLLEMAKGGIHDHVGGGFHRYSTDGDWHLPHFEKMLYDNALLLKSYAVAAKAAKGANKQVFQLCVDGITSWLVREMRAKDGSFYSAIDADSEGGEGQYYVWKHRDLVRLPNGLSFAETYGSRPAGNFFSEETGLLTGDNILHLSDGRQPQQEQLQLLLSMREERSRPNLDDKVLVGWNGLVISGLVAAGEIELASKCADAILKFETAGARLPRYIWDGTAVGEGFLEDYAYFALGLFDLSMKVDRFVAPAERLGSAMRERFYDLQNGGFFSSPVDAKTIFGRSKPVFDQPIPSANSASIRVLSRMGDLAHAEQSLKALSGWMKRTPTACEGLFLALWEFEKLGGAVRNSGSMFKLLRSNFGGGNFSAVIQVDVANGWHLNGLGDGKSVRVSAGGEGLETSLKNISGDSLEVSVRGVVSMAPKKLSIDYQLCSDEMCLVPSSEQIDIL